jgi:peptidoglycan/LPS O-acetylase OafA/YrhL
MNLFIQAARQQPGFSLPLHALRGLAAVIVLLFHLQGRVSEAFPGISYFPVFNGSAAVIFFFVLSGLVVGASLAKNGLTQGSLALYFHRRVFRIMPLMVCTVTIGGLYLLFIDPYQYYSLNPKEYGDFSLLKFIAGYVGYSLKANPPIWSIYVELIASLLIPLMLLFGSKTSHIALALGACILLSLIPLNFKHHWNFYIFSFYAGLSVLLWGARLTSAMRSLAAPLFWLVIALLVAGFYLARPMTGAGYGDLWIVYWETLCITPVVGIIYYSPERFRWLEGRLFRFLGDVSYSLYLTHSILLVILLNLVTSLMGTSAIAALTYVIAAIISSLAIAQLSYRAIEMEGVRLGERLRRPPKPAIDLL